MNQSVSSLPERLLYATSARIGGIGLDLVAEEQLKASVAGGFLSRAIAYRNRSVAIPDAKVRSLRFHPVRLISFIDRPYYYGAKRRYADWIAAREVRTQRYDFLHGWSGDALLALRAAAAASVPSVLDIPTWHCNHGFRTYDLLHVATALLLECDTFWSFDIKATRLAKLEGLRVR